VRLHEAGSTNGGGILLPRGDHVGSERGAEFLSSAALDCADRDKHAKCNVKWDNSSSLVGKYPITYRRSTRKGLATQKPTEQFAARLVLDPICCSGTQSDINELGKYGNINGKYWIFKFWPIKKGSNRGLCVDGQSKAIF